MNKIRSRNIKVWPEYTLNSEIIGDTRQTELVTYVRIKFKDHWFRVLVSCKLQLSNEVWHSRTMHSGAMDDLYKEFINQVHHTTHVYVPKMEDLDDLQMEESERLVFKHKCENQRINPFELLGL